MSIHQNRILAVCSMFFAALVVLAALVLPGSSKASSNADRECGTYVHGFTFHDLSVVRTTCPAGRRVASMWLKRVNRNDCSRFNCRSRKYRCRMIDRTKASYSVRCVKGSRRVRWLVSIE